MFRIHFIVEFVVTVMVVIFIVVFVERLYDGESVLRVGVTARGVAVEVLLVDLYVVEFVSVTDVRGGSV